jgi:hypothetical protein
VTLTAPQGAEKIGRVGTDSDYIEALGEVERSVYGSGPCVLAPEDLPQIRGVARRLVALVLTAWARDLEALGRERLVPIVRMFGPRSLELLHSLAPDERERALHALYDDFVLTPAGPIEPWVRARDFDPAVPRDLQRGPEALRVAPNGRPDPRIRRSLL